jgi:hypothetical protein
MLTIRKAQVALLAEANWRAFRDRAYRHCQEYFPRTCQLLGEEGVWSYVDTGLQKAGSLGFETRRDLLRYLNLVFTFGPDFHELPWAVSILADDSFSAPVRIHILIEAAIDKLREPVAAAEEQAPLSEPYSADGGDAFAGWEEAPPAPVPAPAPLQPPGETALPPAPPNLFRMDDHYAW